MPTAQNRSKEEIDAHLEELKMEYELARTGLLKGAFFSVLLIFGALFSFGVVTFGNQSVVSGNHLVLIYAIIAAGLIVYFAFVFGRVTKLKAEFTQKKKSIEVNAGDKVR